MKKLLQLTLLFVGVNSFAQFSCETAQVLTSNGTVTSPAITGTYKTSCYNDALTKAGGPMYGNWYTFTPNGNGEVTLSSNLPQNVAPFNINTEVSVFVGTCSSLICYTNSDDISSTNSLTTVTFPVALGTTYYIQWDNFYDAAGFDFSYTFNPISCMKTYQSFAGNYTTNSASVVWYNAIGSPASYDVDWSTNLASPAGAGTIVTGVAAGTGTTTQTNITGMTPASSTFRYFVRSNCGGTNSVWSGPFYGYLAKTLPYYNNFEAPNYNDGFGGNNWGFLEVATLGKDGDVFAYSSSSNTAATNATLFSRAISLQAGENVTMSYYTRLFVNSSVTPSAQTLKIYVNNSPTMTGASLATTGGTVNVSGNTYAMHTATYTAPSAGIYYFMFNNATPIVTTPSFLLLDSVNFSSTLKVNDFLTSKFSVYPNPVNNVINFSNNINALINSIDLTDLNGRIIKSISDVNATEGQISVSDLSEGFYMLRISTDQGLAVKKIIKE